MNIIKISDVIAKRQKRKGERATKDITEDDVAWRLYERLDRAVRKAAKEGASPAEIAGVLQFFAKNFEHEFQLDLVASASSCKRMQATTRSL
jgi:hypothetical protein